MEPDAGSVLLQLIEQHYALLYRYAFRLSGSAADAEDLTQHAFLTAQTHLHELRNADRGKSWLCTILRNQYLKERRHRACVTIQSIEDVVEIEGFIAEEPFDTEQLQHVLNELPEEYRWVLILFYFESFSYKDIAEQMGVAVGTVMSRLSRGKAWLRERLSRKQALPDQTATNQFASKELHLEQPAPELNTNSISANASNPAYPKQISPERTLDSAQPADPTPASLRQGATTVAASSWTA